MDHDIEMGDTVVTSKDAIWCDLKGEVVVLHLSSGVYFGLEGVGPEIWQLMQVPCTVAQMVEHLSNHFQVDADTCRASTLAFVGQLAQRELVVVNKQQAVAV